MNANHHAIAGFLWNVANKPRRASPQSHRLTESLFKDQVMTEYNRLIANSIQSVPLDIAPSLLAAVRPISPTVTGKIDVRHFPAPEGESHEAFALS